MRKPVSVLIKELELMNVDVVPVNPGIYHEFLKSRLKPNALNMDWYYEALRKIKKELNINPADYYLVPSNFVKK
ncbi:MAG: hypothetical protein PF572_05960 [Patescibacteria group bacterium]|jgi:hypothetical protein|nr:hypothetical protein [Patescibacteria group bacterium]